MLLASEQGSRDENGTSANEVLQIEEDTTLVDHGEQARVVVDTAVKVHDCYHGEQESHSLLKIRETETGNNDSATPANPSLSGGQNSGANDHTIPQLLDDTQRKDLWTSCFFRSASCASSLGSSSATSGPQRSSSSSTSPSASTLSAWHGIHIAHHADQLTPQEILLVDAVLGHVSSSEKVRLEQKLNNVETLDWENLYCAAAMAVKVFSTVDDRAAAARPTTTGKLEARVGDVPVLAEVVQQLCFNGDGAALLRDFDVDTFSRRSGSTSQMRLSKRRMENPVKAFLEDIFCGSASTICRTTKHVALFLSHSRSGASKRERSKLQNTRTSSDQMNQIAEIFDSVAQIACSRFFNPDWVRTRFFCGNGVPLEISRVMMDWLLSCMMMSFSALRAEPPTPSSSSRRSEKQASFLIDACAAAMVVIGIERREIDDLQRDVENAGDLISRMQRAWRSSTVADLIAALDDISARDFFASITEEDAVDGDTDVDADDHESEGDTQRLASFLSTRNLHDSSRPLLRRSGSGVLRPLLPFEALRQGEQVDVSELIGNSHPGGAAGLEFSSSSSSQKTRSRATTKHLRNVEDLFFSGDKGEALLDGGAVGSRDKKSHRRSGSRRKSLEPGSIELVASSAASSRIVNSSLAAEPGLQVVSARVGYVNYRQVVALKNNDFSSSPRTRRHFQGSSTVPHELRSTICENVRNLRLGDEMLERNIAANCIQENGKRSLMK
ncbi:unnamed protein product [Amoebophrya sp. A25]|nr:unnamed protein product [Amoebophrya sp. A25]|eukprot:GSA25T00010319001.1